LISGAGAAFRVALRTFLGAAKRGREQGNGEPVADGGGGSGAGEGGWC
jgi:hypothetical protein